LGAGFVGAAGLHLPNVGFVVLASGAFHVYGWQRAKLDVFIDYGDLLLGTMLDDLCYDGFQGGADLFFVSAFFAEQFKGRFCFCFTGNEACATVWAKLHAIHLLTLFAA
jgi:hypothetical protein